MAVYVKQQCVAEWRLIDEGNVSRSPSLTQSSCLTVHVRDAFQDWDFPHLRGKTDFP